MNERGAPAKENSAWHDRHTRCLSKGGKNGGARCGAGGGRLTFAVRPLCRAWHGESCGGVLPKPRVKAEAIDLSMQKVTPKKKSYWVWTKPRDPQVLNIS